jgi:hypothetical protein
MLDLNQETTNSLTTNNEFIQEFSNFDFNFEDQDKKRTKKNARQQEISQNQNFKYIPKHAYDGVRSYD